jgi:hypothetical protein
MCFLHQFQITKSPGTKMMDCRTSPPMLFQEARKVPGPSMPPMLDGDGDLDVLSASTERMTKSPGMKTTASSISPAIPSAIGTSGANSVYAADVDGDGDMDVLSAIKE